MKKKLTTTVLRLLEQYIKEQYDLNIIVISYSFNKKIIVETEIKKKFIIPLLEFNLYMILNTSK